MNGPGVTQNPNPAPGVRLDAPGALIFAERIRFRAIANGCVEEEGWRTANGSVFRRGRLTIFVSVAQYEDGHIWAHVSASTKEALPAWFEMKRVKDWTLGPEQKAIIVVAPASEHVNIHPHTHHLWACLDGDPLPDFSAFV